MTCYHNADLQNTSEGTPPARNWNRTRLSVATAVTSILIGFVTGGLHELGARIIAWLW